MRRKTVVLTKTQAARTTLLEEKIEKILTGNQEEDTAVLLHLLSKKMKEDEHGS